MTNLPLWVQENLPPLRSLHTLTYDEVRKVYFLELAGVTVYEAETFEEVYDYGREKELDFTFSTTLPKYHPTHDGFIFDAPDEQGLNRLFLAYTDGERVQHLEETYEDFLNLAKLYEEQPKNFKLAYEYVNSHPAFWIKEEEGYTLRWSTSNNHSFEVWPYFEEEQVQCWYVEGGPHSDDLHSHNRDPRLMAHGATVEEAYIAFAAALHKNYSLTGEDRQLPDEEAAAFQAKLATELKNCQDRHSKECILCEHC